MGCNHSASTYGYIAAIVDSTTGYIVGLQTPTSPTSPIYFTVFTIEVQQNTDTINTVSVTSTSAPPSTDSVHIIPFTKNSFLNNIQLSCNPTTNQALIELTDTSGATFHYTYPVILPNLNSSNTQFCIVDPSNNVGSPPSATAVMNDFYICVNANLLQLTQCAWSTATPVITIISSAGGFTGIANSSSSGPLIGIQAIDNKVYPLVAGQSVSNAVVTPFPGIVGTDLLYAVSFSEINGVVTDNFLVQGSNNVTSASISPSAINLPANIATVSIHSTTPTAFNSTPVILGNVSTFHSTDNTIPPDVNPVTGLSPTLLGQPFNQSPPATPIVVTFTVGQNPSIIATASLGDQNFDWILPTTVLGNFDITNTITASTPATPATPATTSATPAATTTSSTPAATTTSSTPATTSSSSSSTPATTSTSSSSTPASTSTTPATTSSTPATTSTTSTPTTSSSSSSSSSNTGMIVGIVVGIFLLFVIIGGALYYRSRKQKNTMTTTTTTTPYGKIYKNSPSALNMKSTNFYNTSRYRLS